MSTLAEMAEALRRLDALPRESGHALPSKDRIRAEAAVIRAARALVAGQSTELPAGRVDVLESLARRLLWLAFCWNDHNFDAAHKCAREEAARHGITDLDKANDWLSGRDLPETKTAGITSPKLEERYIVVKLKDLIPSQAQELRDYLTREAVPTRDCVVVEADWPQYEQVVDMVVGDQKC